jgi:rhodanese-related sulfurtransferase
VKRILLEGLAVAVVGALLALVANSVSPRRIELSRNYFPSTPSSAGASLAANPGKSTSTNAHVLSAAEQAVLRLKEEGLGVIDLNEVTQLFNDPRREQDLVVFVDARKDEHYEEGHIPGAYQFDYYYPAKYAGVVLPLCQNAQQVVVYCTGGDCEDSRLTAVMLSQAGIDKAKLFVYAGGITEWKAKKLPLEIGARKSGVIQNTNTASAADQTRLTSQ